MKIAFYEIPDWQAEYLKPKLQGHELFFSTENFTDDNLPLIDAEIISTFVGSPVTPKVLQHCSKLKFIATRTTGYDHINKEACAQKGVAISNVPTYGENTVAEFTFALLLALSRKIYQAIRQIREQALFSVEKLQGFDLQGKTIGVVGVGHIGAYVVKIANGFGMNVLAYEPHPKAELAKQYNFKYVSLEDLLKQSDIITLHVPYMPATHHLINAENLKLAKKGSILINTARGGLVDTQGLVWALREGILAGVAIDVLEEEGFIKDELDMLISGHPNAQQLKVALEDHELMHMDNVIITPHNAFNTKEALMRILDTTVANIQGFISGKPINIVSS